MRDIISTHLRPLVLACAFCVMQTANAQDFSNVDVQSLSDSQVSQYWQRAQAQGVPLSQVRSLAVARGMNPAQADLLVARIQELQGGGQQSLLQGQTDLRTLQNTPGMESFLDGSEIGLPLSAFEERLFGYKLFHNENVDFSPNFNIPTPGNYILGPGDELLVQIYGTSQEAYELLITPEGRVTIPLVGPVGVGGLSIDAASARLKQALGRIYSGLLSSKPSVFMELTLGSIRSIRVTMVGEVSKPGTYALPAFASPFMALYASGGPTVDGTFRAIEVYRDAELAAKIDVYEFLRSGTGGRIGRLEDNDFIVVRPYYNHIELVGAVKRAGIYELLDGETLMDLINYAGGFKAGAIRESISIERLNGGAQSIQDVPLSESLQLVDGDRIIVREAADPLIEKVQVEGAVANPGAYGWSDGLSLAQLIEKSGGFSPEAYLETATLFRKKSDLSTETISLQLSDILESGTSFDLEIGDLLVVSSRYELSETPFVQVSGEVINPGVMPYFDGMTVADAVLLSSGLRNSGIAGHVELVRRPGIASGDFEVLTFDIPNEAFPFQSEDLKTGVLPYDHIFVRQAPGYRNPAFVEVEGEVVAPGKYILSNRETRISEILPRSGGITKQAFVDGAHLLRPTEEVKLRERAKQYLQNVERLNLFLTDQLSGGTLSEVERNALNIRLDGLRKRYRQILINSGEFEADSLIDQSMDSVFIDRPREYAKIPFSLKEIISGVSNPENDLILRDGDKLVIPLEPQTVKISGEVLQEEAFTRYQKGLAFDNYISAAGGYTPEAKKGKAYVLYPNGSAKRSRNFLLFKSRPEVLPGSEVIVPGGRVRERFSIDRIFGLVTTAATTYLLFLTIQDRQSQ